MNLAHGGIVPGGSPNIPLTGMELAPALTDKLSIVEGTRGSLAQLAKNIVSPLAPLLAASLLGVFLYHGVKTTVTGKFSLPLMRNA